MSKDCPYCGMEIPDNASICPYCNKQQPLFKDMSAGAQIFWSLFVIAVTGIILFCVISCTNNSQNTPRDIPRSVQGVNLCSSTDSVVDYLREKGYNYEIVSKEHIYVDLEHSSYEGISLNLYFVNDRCFGMAYQPTKDRSEFDYMSRELKENYPMRDENKGIGENGDAVLYSYSNGLTKIKLRTDVGAIAYYDVKLDSVNRQLHPNEY